MLATLTSPVFWTQFVTQTGRSCLWFLFVIGVLSVFEQLWPAGPQPSWTERLHNVWLVILVSIVVAFLNIAMMYLPDTLHSYGLMSAVFGTWNPSTFGEVCLATLIYLLCADILQYWFHRAQHSFAGLWFAHALHHDDARMNAATALRNTMWHAIFGFFVIQIPLAIICGPNLLTYVAAVFFYATYGFFNHANIRLDMGFVGKIISGPHWHRLHHGREPQYFNTNYAALFPFLDLVFGTYRAPVTGEFPETGLADRPMRTPSFGNLIQDVAGR